MWDPQWVMVGITSIYVIASIWIMKANLRSASAAEKALEESKAALRESKKHWKSHRTSSFKILNYRNSIILLLSDRQYQLTIARSHIRMLLVDRHL